MKRTLLTVLGIAAVGIGAIALWLFNAPSQRRIAEAQAQVNRWAEKLHGQTTDAGVYVRHQGECIPENDPWGILLHVDYTQGGFAETLEVRSSGPDKAFYTEDDIVAKRSVMNLKGIGQGAKENVEEFAQKGARGVVKGATEGIKDTVHGALGGRKQEPSKKD
jgi:hypothetical protein